VPPEGARETNLRKGDLQKEITILGLYRVQHIVPQCNSAAEHKTYLKCAIPLLLAPSFVCALGGDHGNDKGQLEVIS